MAKLVITSPLAGWSTPLEEVPDETFAKRLVGDGVAIDPVNDTLHAPCDAEIVSIPASNHAVTLRAADGAELLLHVGIDTVKLGGRGFTALKRAGARVKAGDPLIRFDLDQLARYAPSLLTPVLVMDGSSRAIVRRWESRSVDVGDPLFELESTAETSAATVAESTSGITQRFTVHFEHGIHARPAALLANAIKHLAAEVSMAARGRKANVRSGVALMTLGVRRGDEVVVSAAGTDAQAAVTALSALLAPGAVHESPAEPSRKQLSRENPATPEIVEIIRGVTASSGIAVGRAVQIGRPEISIAETGAGIELENSRLTAALNEVRGRIAARVASSTGALREVMEAHLAFIDDPELLAATRALIARGKSAAFAWRQAIDDVIEILRAVDDPRIAERVDDLDDLATQVLLSLEGKTTDLDLPERAIVLAKELMPSQFASLPRDKLAGICTAAGGPTSHVAILAQAAGIPAIVAAGPAVLAVPAGSEVFLNADRGMLHVAPNAEALRAAEAMMRERRERMHAARSRAHEECRMADGTRIEVFANVGSLAEAKLAMEHGAEGCGLLRTEFLFLDRDSPPSEEEQRERYQAIVDAFGGRPVILRTLDAGGDKPIPYLPLPREENPALGLRGVRTSLRRPDLLDTQLRAALTVRPPGLCRIMLPMINSVAEIRAVRQRLEDLRQAMNVPTPPLGIMIETPAAALGVAQLAKAADFFSIGTNDLTQYTLAMDRGHQALAGQIDALDPAVLKLIALAASAAAESGRKISMCGGLASDPVAPPILIGLGVHSLSLVTSAIAPAKALIRSLTLADCRALAQRALEQESAAAVRSILG